MPRSKSEETKREREAKDIYVPRVFCRFGALCGTAFGREIELHRDIEQELGNQGSGPIVLIHTLKHVSPNLFSSFCMHTYSYGPIVVIVVRLNGTCNTTFLNVTFTRFRSGVAFW